VHPNFFGSCERQLRVWPISFQVDKAILNTVTASLRPSETQKAPGDRVSESQFICNLLRDSIFTPRPVRGQCSNWPIQLNFIVSYFKHNDVGRFPSRPGNYSPS
jgi:hypothetical protein